MTIVVGATFYLASEALKERERCKQVKADCIAKCTEETLPNRDAQRGPVFPVSTKMPGSGGLLVTVV